MVGEAFPIDASAGAPSYTAAEYRKLFATQLMNAVSTTDAFAARFGRRPGPGMVASSTTSTYTVTAGSYVALPNFATGQGAYMCEFPANETGSITAPHATLPRKDILYVIVDDTAVDGSGQRRAQVLYLAGTANASPVAPAVPTRGNLLATLSVPANGGGNPTALMGQMTVASGGILPVVSSVDYPAIRQESVYVDDQATDTLYRDDGTAMRTVYAATRPWTPVITGDTSNPSVGNGLVTASYALVGDLCYFAFQFAFGSTTGGGSGYWRIVPPVATAVSNEQAFGTCRLVLPLNGIQLMGTLSLTPATGISPYFPLDFSTNAVFGFRSADASGASGTGIPNVPANFPVQPAGILWMSGAYLVR